MNLKEYPSLYQASDKASSKAQQYYLFVVAVDLSFMILGAALAIYGFKNDGYKTVIYSLSGIFLVLSLIFTIVLKTKAYEDVWYQGRALAESVKTLTWRFITCSELFESTLPSYEARKVFVERLKELSQEFKDLNRTLDANVLSEPPITAKMEDIRSLDTIKRKEYYIAKRIKDQKEWYSAKAEFNKRRYNIWFGVIIVGQFLAIISTVILIKWPSSDWNFVGLFTTISAASLSWLQLKQHQELRQAYTTAAQELSFIEADSHFILSDDQLSKFVLDSENAVSREHTLWLAQKRK